MKSFAYLAESRPKTLGGNGNETGHHGQIGILNYVIVAFQIILVLGVVVAYRLELERGFAVVAGLILVGFLVHSWLPLRSRLPFFLALSISAIGLLLGTNGLWLVVLGLALIAACHLPFAWPIRVCVLVLAAICLATLRSGWIRVGWGETVLPVLGAIFMFRLILYMYDLKEERTPANIWQRLSYFFLLPNICFPLFPVIDYKTFLRTYYDAPAAEIYQKGVFWMFRGVAHLLLYRLIYFLLPRAETDLPGLLGVYVFMAMTYALYLRVSGLFHLIVGSLCLFGFNLPLTNNHYFLASSFNDLWRRINIYWKEFMMTAAFYPVFMGNRQLGIASRLVIATGFVFLVTWFLHSYQWFWLQGVFPVAATDILFWGVLGVGLAMNSVWEAHQGRKRVVRAPVWSIVESMGTTLRIIGVFSFMALIWSLWNSSSVGEWGHRLLRVTESRAGDVAAFCGLVSATIVLGISASWLNARGRGPVQAEQLARRHAHLLVPVIAIGLILVSYRPIHFRMGEPVTVAVTLAQSTSLNSIDRRRQERGYYEQLSRATQLGARTSFGFDAGMPFGGAAEWAFLGDTPAAIETEDIRGIRLRPNIEIKYHGATLRTNQWGLRDRDYEKTKSPAFYRIALVGPSSAMGSGVDNDETFENQFEDELNRSLSGQKYQEFEILNFSVGGYGVLEALYVVRNLIPDFTPNAVMYVVHPGESYRMFDRLRRRLLNDVALHVKPSTRLGTGYEPVMAALRESDANPDLPAEEFIRRLDHYSKETLIWAYEEMIEACGDMGARFVLLLVPMPGENFTQAEREMLVSIVHDAGGEFLDLSEAFDGYETGELKVAEWDEHPNELGHRLIAKQLYSELMDRASVIGMSLITRVEQSGNVPPHTADN